MRHLYTKVPRLLVVGCMLAFLFAVALPATSYAATSTSTAHSSSGTTKLVTLQEGLALGVVKPVYGHREQVNVSSNGVRPNTLTVYCWLAHDAEVTNADARWCLAGSGGVAIFNVSRIFNNDSNTWVFFGVRGSSIVGYNLAPKYALSGYLYEVVCINVGGTC